MSNSKLQDIKRKLMKFGLSETQAKVYLLLVEHKELRIQEIVRLSRIPRSSVYENLNRLYEFGIAEEIVEDSFKKVRPYTVGAMRHGLDEKLLEIERLKSDLKELEQSIALTKSYNPHGATTIRYYKGRSGARQIYWNILNAKQTIYSFNEWGRERYVGIKFYENFVFESRFRGIKDKVIINPTKYNLESIQKYTYSNSPVSRTNIEDIRALAEEKMQIKGDTIIYDNIFAQVYLDSIEINGFEIENAQFAKSQRSIFEIVWNTAKPITEVLK